MGFSKVRRTSFAVFAVAALVLASCGDDDDDAAGAEQAASADASAEAEDTTSAEADDTAGDEAEDTASAEAEDTTSAEAEDTASAEADDSDDVITVDDIGDIPEECIDLMGDYLEQLEPFVEDIDWSSASLDQLQQLTEEMGEEFSDIESDMTDAGCDNYDFTTDVDSMQAAIDLAEDRAPGTVAWLKFIQQLSSGISTDSGDAGGDTGGGEAAGDLPTDCDGAKAYIEDLMKEHASMMELAIGDIQNVGQVIQTITTVCPAGDMSDFLSREDVTKFMQGT